MIRNSNNIAEQSGIIGDMQLPLANSIIRSSLFLREMEAIREYEAERIFCRHDMEHLLAVARIALIMCLEKGIGASRDLIYSAALLHDIGRGEQYRSGVPHDKAGVEVAERILDGTDCDDDTRQAILGMICTHRSGSSAHNPLEAVFAAADKRSRLCFACKAQKECNWPAEKRNSELEV